MEFIGRDDLDGLYVDSPRPPRVQATVSKIEQRKRSRLGSTCPTCFSTDKDYATVIRNGSVINMPKLTTADVYRVNKIFGRNIPSYMGKNTRRLLPKVELGCIHDLSEYIRIQNGNIHGIA